MREFYHILFVALISWLLGFPVYRWLVRKNIIDKPNERSSHDNPTARGGGIAIVTAIFLTAVLLSLARQNLSLFIVTVAAVVISIVSFIDDVRSLSPLVRFGCHAVTAVVALAALQWPQVSIEIGPGTGVVLARSLGSALVFLWIAGYTNAFNFMDGINGIAAGQAAVTGLGMALLGSVASGQWSVVSPPVLLSFAIAGAALGFLPHNFPRAKMFMGDVSSAPLGFLLAVLVVWLSKEFGWWLLFPLSLLHANFVLDTAITLLRRIVRKEKWYSSHREHFYQRLIRSGKSHAFVTGWEMALQVVVLGLMVLYLHASVPVRVGLIALVILVWLAFFAFCERLFRSNNVRRSAGGPSHADVQKHA